jgi:hypothetical protein
MKHDRFLQGNAEYTLWEQEVDKKVDALPSLDIVTCGECVRANHELSGVYCGISDVLMGANGFCSIGKRKESE